MAIKCSTCREPVDVCGCHDGLDDDAEAADEAPAERLETIAKTLQNQGVAQRQQGQAVPGQIMVDAAGQIRDVIQRLEDS